MYRCLSCSKEVHPQDPRIDDKSHPNYGRCPECGHRGTPVDTENMVTLSIPWQELKVLCTWAERWAWASETVNKDFKNEYMPKVVYGIVDRILMQHMDQKTPLTLRSEFSELSGMGLKISQNIITEE